MGRIKTSQIKRITNDLIKLHKDEFKEDFKENKELVAKFANIPSKKMKNVIAGYVTRLTKKKEEA